MAGGAAATVWRGGDRARHFARSFGWSSRERRQREGTREWLSGMRRRRGSFAELSCRSGQLAGNGNNSRDIFSFLVPVSFEGLILFFLFNLPVPRSFSKLKQQPGRLQQ